MGSAQSMSFDDLWQHKAFWIGMICILKLHEEIKRSSLSRPLSHLIFTWKMVYYIHTITRECGNIVVQNIGKTITLSWHNSSSSLRYFLNLFAGFLIITRTLPKSEDVLQACGALMIHRSLRMQSRGLDCMSWSPKEKEEVPLSSVIL